MGVDTVWYNARLAALDSALPGLCVVEQGAAACAEGRIAFAGLLAIWDIGAPAELVWRIGFNPLHRRVWRGA